MERRALGGWHFTNTVPRFKYFSNGLVKKSVTRNGELLDRLFKKKKKLDTLINQRSDGGRKACFSVSFVDVS